MMATERWITAAEKSADEEQQAFSLRPTTLAEYVGQAEVVERIRIAIEAARARGEAIEHLLVHGFMDDNVHFRGAVAFLSAAQRGGRAVDQDFYPRGAHGIGGRTERLVLYRRMERFWAENLAR